MILAGSTIGVLLIVAGFLCKAYPNLIAGYNTLSNEEKEKVDIEKLSSLMKNGLIIIGVLSFITGISLHLLNIKEHYGIFIIGSIVILGISIMGFSARKFNP